MYILVKFSMKIWLIKKKVNYFKKKPLTDLNSGSQTKPMPKCLNPLNYDDIQPIRSIQAI